MTGAAERYCQQVSAWQPMREWFAAAQKEPEHIDELDIEF
jgi:glutathione S-transferase